MQIKGTPWGGWQIVAEGKGYRVKLLTILPGQRFSLQKHLHRTEDWHIVSSRGIATRGSIDFNLVAGDDFHVPLGVKHRLKNSGHMDMLVVEIQRGEKLDEKDIERIEDDYGRSSS